MLQGQPATIDNDAQRCYWLVDKKIKKKIPNASCSPLIEILGYNVTSDHFQSCYQGLKYDIDARRPQNWFNFVLNFFFLVNF